MLSDIFPDSIHVRNENLQLAGDQEIWDFAKNKELIIVTKDADFRQMSFLYSFPPKVIWIRKGNCTTKEIEKVLRVNFSDIEKFSKDKEATFLTLE